MDLPPALLQSLQNVKGFNQEAFIQVHQSGQQITSIRLNPEKLKIQNLKFKTEGHVLWSSLGYYLPSRPSFTLDPLFHAGAYYVQEASSMFLEEVIKQKVDLSKPLKILDLCAAPGGKSTLIQSIISKESLLVSNEVIKTRVNILSENITKWGAANVIVTNNDPKDFEKLKNYFDVIVVDAPCSGSGLFRKDPNAIGEWSQANVALCAQRQQRILADILPSLKAGGCLFYSTCSFSPQEDEDVLDWLIHEFYTDDKIATMESLRFMLEDDWGIVETVSDKTNAYGYRFYPGKVKGEGFFIAGFKKADVEDGGSQTAHRNKKIKKTFEKLSNTQILIVQPYLLHANDFFFIKQNEDVLAIPMQLEKELETLQHILYIKKAGVKLGTIIRNELVPAHELAVSNIINTNVNRCEVDLENALQYLRKQELKIECPYNGWVILTYKNLPLGWIKVIGNRINNYYPSAWRILNK